VEVGDVVKLSLLALLDFLTTRECLLRGFLDLNPFISLLGIWVYPALFPLAVLACWFLDALALKWGAELVPSRLIALVYILAICNNVFWLLPSG